jgi:hypothetical protein
VRREGGRRGAAQAPEDLCMCVGGGGMTDRDWERERLEALSQRLVKLLSVADSGKAGLETICGGPNYGTVHL